MAVLLLPSSLAAAFVRDVSYLPSFLLFALSASTY
ncbi:hypothetical protein LINPERPRIM_LOCUS21792 [Linum perenne]